MGYTIQFASVSSAVACSNRPSRLRLHHSCGREETREVEIHKRTSNTAHAANPISFTITGIDLG
jgi:hypothetical protein